MPTTDRWSAAEQAVQERRTQNTARLAIELGKAKATIRRVEALLTGAPMVSQAELARALREPQRGDDSLADATAAPDR
jgi:hypothetical protein